MNCNGRLWFVCIRLHAVSQNSVSHIDLACETVRCMTVCWPPLSPNWVRPSTDLWATLSRFNAVRLVLFTAHSLFFSQTFESYTYKLINFVHKNCNLSTKICCLFNHFCIFIVRQVYSYDVITILWSNKLNNGHSVAAAAVKVTVNFCFIVLLVTYITKKCTNMSRADIGDISPSMKISNSRASILLIFSLCAIYFQCPHSYTCAFDVIPEPLARYDRSECYRAL